MMTCEHLTNGRVCAVASRIADAPCVASEEQCSACTSQPEPRTVNIVTASIAIKQTPDRNRVIASHGFLVQRSPLGNMRPSTAPDPSSAKTCRFAMDGQCQVSTLLAEVPVPLHPATCHTCKLQDSPMAVNRVTCSAARAARVKAGLDTGEDLHRCLAPKKSGIGTELETIILVWQQRLGRLGMGWLLAKSQDCNCEAMKAELNAISIEEATRYRAQLAQWIHDNWQKRFPQLALLRFFTRLAANYALSRATSIYRQRFHQRRSCDASS